MKAKDYKKGSSALRRIINNREVEFARQFAKFNFYLPDKRYRESRMLQGIWNTKTDNMVAFINKKDVVFMRPGSLYSSKMFGDKKHKVIKYDKFNNLRSIVNRSTRQFSKWHLLAELAVDRFIANKDKPNRVFMFSVNGSEEFDTAYINRTIKSLLDANKYKNTLYALDHSFIERVQVFNKDKYKVYIQIDDYTEMIAKQERLDRIKREIANSFLDNITDIARSSIHSGSSLNPLQFTYDDGGEILHGIIRSNRFDIDFVPEETDIREFLSVEGMMRNIEFTEPLYSLAERGIDEQPARNEMEDVSARMVEYVRARYSNEIYPPVNYMYANESPYGHVVQSVWDEAEESVPEEPSMPDQAEWHSVTMVRDDYPAGSEYDPTTSG